MRGVGERAVRARSQALLLDAAHQSAKVSGRQRAQAFVQAIQAGGSPGAISFLPACAARRAAAAGRALPGAGRQDTGLRPGMRRRR
jgi:hypothetical protein